MNNALYSISDVAKYIGVSKPTVYSWINRKVNPLKVIPISDRIVRIAESDLNNFLQNCSQVA